MKPILLGPNQPARFYRGGPAIARFRGLSPNGDNVPEDWVASTTAIFGDGSRGLTVLPDGRLLRDAVAAESEGFLGPEHVRHFGADPALLVKLLDAGERLPVHAHPDRRFAHDRLGAPHGKSEAWLIVGVEGAQTRIHLGFREDVEPAALAEWVSAQDGAAMLAALNEVSVAPGDCIYVPAGTPHSIGEGVLMVEVQEPSDLGVLLEWSRFGLERPEEATMGLGFDVAVECVRRAAVDRDELASWTRRSDEGPEVRPGARPVVPAAAERFFRAEWLRPAPSVALAAGYSVLVVVSGAGQLDTDGGALGLVQGNTVLLPHAAGAGELTGAVEAVRCLPPRVEVADR
jgi:mannose-6-phosphate isomerase